jgi:hypothetical protein
VETHPLLLLDGIIEQLRVRFFPDIVNALRIRTRHFEVVQGDDLQAKECFYWQVKFLSIEQNCQLLFDRFGKRLLLKIQVSRRDNKR